MPYPCLASGCPPFECPMLYFACPYSFYLFFLVLVFLSFFSFLFFWLFLSSKTRSWALLLSARRTRRLFVQVWAWSMTHLMTPLTTFRRGTTQAHHGVLPCPLHLPHGDPRAPADEEKTAPAKATSERAAGLPGLVLEQERERFG